MCPVKPTHQVEWEAKMGRISYAQNLVQVDKD